MSNNGETQVRDNTDGFGTQVYIIGAGPGDSELLTVKAQRILALADVVLYDYLAHPNVVMLAQSAIKLCVGKKKGAHSMSQEDIHALLLKYSKTHARIVRLKGGDPMIFGRSGEEMAFLRQHNIPFRIVPGITSAIAVPTYAGIPLTHRDVSQSVAFVTATRANDIQNMQFPVADTLVIMMGLLRLEAVVERLIEDWPTTTPIAIIASGTLAAERVLEGTLDTICGLQVTEQLAPPALLVVGKVVSYREVAKWRDALPLHAKRFVLFRADHQQSQCRRLLQDSGAEVLSFPLNKMASQPAALQSLDLGSYTHIIFTSENGVRSFFACLAHQRRDVRCVAQACMVAIGPHTRACLAEYGIQADVVPEQHDSEGVVAALEGQLSAQHKVLVPTSSEAGDVLVNGITCTQAQCDQVAVYTNCVPDNIADMQAWVQPTDYLVFMNAASVHRFFADGMPGAQYTEWGGIYSIGPKTTAAIKQYTSVAVVQADVPSVDALVGSILA
jgi:uroporphyrinogen III methyltransferase / synthase